MQRPIKRHGPHSRTGPHRPTTLPEVELEIVRGRARQTLRPVETQAYLIGTAEDSDLVLGDPQFSDTYAYLLRSPLGVVLRWLRAGPELTVNGHPVVDAVPLHDGDRLRTGPYEFRVHVSWPATQPTDSVSSPLSSSQSSLQESAPASSSASDNPATTRLQSDHARLHRTNLPRK